MPFAGGTFTSAEQGLLDLVGVTAATFCSRLDPPCSNTGAGRTTGPVERF